MLQKSRTQTNYAEPRTNNPIPESDTNGKIWALGISIALFVFIIIVCHNWATAEDEYIKSIRNTKIRGNSQEYISETVANELGHKFFQEEYPNFNEINFWTTSLLLGGSVIFFRIWANERYRIKNKSRNQKIRDRAKNQVDISNFKFFPEALTRDQCISELTRVDKPYRRPTPYSNLYLLILVVVIATIFILIAGQS